MLWSHAEVFFGVLAFTLPGFRFLLRRWFGASVSQPATGASKATTDIDTYNSKCFQQLLSQESLPPFSMGMECYRPTENLSTTLSIEDEGSFVGNGLKPTPPRKNS